ncbi:hypothetical protein LSPH24S_04566 [Lysinibacillus sphaericus]
MYFNANDVTSFLAQKDFIDTAIVPLVGIDFAAEKLSKVAQKQITYYR